MSEIHSSKLRKFDNISYSNDYSFADAEYVKYPVHDQNRDVKSTNDWSIACTFKLKSFVGHPSGQSFHCLYSDYGQDLATNGYLFIGIEAGVDALRIIQRGPSGDFGLPIPFNQSFVDAWTCLTINYTTSTNSIEVIVNAQSLGTFALLSSDPFGGVDGDDFGVFGQSRNNINAGFGSYRSFCTFNRKMTYKEYALFYEKNLIHEDLYLNCGLWLPFNDAPLKLDGWTKNEASLIYDGGVTFSEVLTGDFVIEATYKSYQSGSVIGITTNVTDTFLFTDFQTVFDVSLTATINNFDGYLLYDNLGGTNSLIEQRYDDVIKIERISNVVTVYVNNVQAVAGHTTTVVGNVRVCYATATEQNGEFRGVSFTSPILDGTTKLTATDRVEKMQSYYVGIKDLSSTINPNVVEKIAQVCGLTDNQVGVSTLEKGITSDCLLKDFYTNETEDVFGLDMGKLWHTEGTDGGSFKIPALSGATSPPVAGFASGWSLVFKGNFKRLNLPLNTAPVAWFIDETASFTLHSVFQTEDGFIRQEVRNTSGTLLGTLNIPIADIDKDITLTITASAGGDYKAYIDGFLALETSFTYQPIQDNSFNMRLGVMEGVATRRFFKNLRSTRIFDKVLTPAEASNTLGSYLDSLTPICNYATHLEGSSLYDSLGNCDPTTGGSWIGNQGINYIVEKDSGFQPRRKGLKFDVSKQQYLKILDVAQIDADKGITVIVSVENYSDPSNIGRSIAYFGDSDPVVGDKFIRVGYRPSLQRLELLAGPNSTNLPFFVGTETSKPRTLAFNITNGAKIIKFDGNKAQVGTMNGSDRQFVNLEVLVRTDPTFDLYLGGVEQTAYPSTLQFMNVTIRSFMVFNGLLTDEEIKEVSDGIVRNPSIEIQNKYGMLVYVDFNNVYDDGGTLKVKDLSPNNYTIEAKSFNGLGWQTLTDLQNSATDL